MATPKLRFKEFEGSWLASKIGEVFEVTSGATPLRSNKEFFKNANIPWVKTTDLNNAVITHTEEQISKVALKSTSVKMLPKGTVFVAMYGGFNQIGRTGLLANEATCNQALSAIYPNENIDSRFLLDYLNHNVKLWKSFAASSRKDPNITKGDVLAFPFNFPNIAEQTKIATFLSAIDTKIDELTQKHELLTDYKKGMMQQIFSQKLRFKADDGSDFEDWEDRTLGEVVNFFNGKRVPLSSSERQKRQGDYRYFGASGVIDHVDDYIFDGEYILIGEDGANILTRSSPLAFLVTGKFWLNNHAHIFRSKNGNNFFLASYLETLNYEQYNSGTAQPKLNLKNLKDIPVINPILEEQTKIANFLTAIDQKIDNVAEQIDHAKTWKKGLLQQMFV
ncbi:restriction endonuclease subunit S [Psychrobacter sp. DM8]|uniref:restriction endonuclease subunit S n=1 Tax=Psychrobacter sp. DM8 TaxID=3440636 RepID=UPI003F506829